MKRCGESKEDNKLKLSISHFVKLDYETLEELVSSASQAAGYLTHLGREMNYPNARDIAARLDAALKAVTK